jgi:hypothetical protein
MIDDFLDLLAFILKGIGAMLAICFIFFLVGLSIYGIYNMFQTPEDKAKYRQAEIDRATPKLYAVTDGCSVYRWYADGHAHYFTKCQDKVTTEANHSEYCGKACTRTVTETIETKRAK